MTIAAFKGTCPTCGHDHDRENAEFLRALKREPNAAGRATGREQSHAAGDGQPAASSAAPVPAAPDVASMVKRLRDCCAMIGYATSGAERASHKRNADAAEAAILAKLGEGAPLSADYIQTVPDKCDRIIWRGRYYHLPLAPGASDE